MRRSHPQKYYALKIKAPKTSQPEQLLKISQISKLLKVSVVTIHKWKKDGKIPFHRISNRIFFKESEVLESLQSTKRISA